MYTGLSRVCELEQELRISSIENLISIIIPKKRAHLLFCPDGLQLARVLIEIFELGCRLG